MMFSKEKRETEKAALEERDANPESQWEYKAINLNWKASVAFESEFNKLGKKGWEFIAVAGRDNVHRAIFKRRGVPAA